MIQVFNLSGGRSSARLVRWAEDNKKRMGWETEYIFADTGAEHPKTYDFIRDIIKHWGIDVTCLKAIINQKLGIGNEYLVVDHSEIGYDLSLMEQHVRKNGNFTVARKHCTDRLKGLIMDKYKKDKYGKGNYITWLGVRVDEPKRLKYYEQQVDMFSEIAKSPIKIRYMAEVLDDTKGDVIDWWKGQPFDLDLPEHLGNCVFCIEKGPAKIALAARDEPEMFEAWSNLMQDEATVRKMKSDHLSAGHIYRGFLSPELITRQFEGYTYDELYEKVYRGKGLDTGVCSESCEPIPDASDFRLEQYD